MNGVSSEELEAIRQKYGITGVNLDALAGMDFSTLDKSSKSKTDDEEDSKCLCGPNFCEYENVNGQKKHVMQVCCECDDADIVVIITRRGKALSRASVDRVACWGQRSAASGAIARADRNCFAWRDEGAPAPPQWHVNTEAAQSGADGACEAGARAKLVLQTDENDAAAILAEDARLGTAEVCPLANVTDLVVAQPAG